MANNKIKGLTITGRLKESGITVYIRNGKPQLCDQYMVIRNYAKQTDGLFARIIGKISALTVAQYINYLNNQPIGRVKYALV